MNYTERFRKQLTAKKLDRLCSTPASSKPTWRSSWWTSILKRLKMGRVGIFVVSPMLWACNTVLIVWSRGILKREHDSIFPYITRTLEQKELSRSLHIFSTEIRNKIATCGCSVTHYVCVFCSENWSKLADSWKHPWFIPPLLPTDPPLPQDDTINFLFTLTLFHDELGGRYL